MNLKSQDNSIESTKKLAKSTAAIVIFALIGKLMGFGRESLMAYRFGTGVEKAAWTVAQSSTGLMSILITEAIATTFIPQLQKVALQKGEEGKNRYTNNMIFLTGLIALTLSVLGILFAPFVAKLTGGRFDQKSMDLLIQLIRMAMPLIIFSALVGVMTGYQQFHGRFAAAGAIALPLNAVYILYLVFLAPQYGIYGVAIASVLGVVAQAIFLMPGTKKAGFHLKPVFDIHDKYAKESILLALPVLVTVSVNNINVIVNKYLATGLGAAAVSRLDYANKLNLLVLGIFIAAITAVIFPSMSKAFAEGNMLLGKRIMSGAVKAVLLITVPAAIGLIVLARPIVEIAFQRGAFTPEDTLATASVLKFYAITLIALSVNNVLNRVYYSLQDTTTPFYIGVVNVVLNAVINVIVVNIWGINGMAASVSFAATVAAMLRLYFIRRTIGHIGGKSLARALVKTGLAGGVMAAFCILTFYPLEIALSGILPGGSLLVLGKLALLLVVVSCAVILYGTMLYLLGFREVKDLIELIQRRREGENHE